MSESNRLPTGAKGAVVIGCSAGGLEALENILPALPKDFPAPVIVVQHQARGRASQLPELLARHCQLPVKEADEKEPALAGHIYTAPPDYHLLMEQDETFSLSVDEEVNHSRPSIDVSFEALLDVYGARLVAVVLTGADADGSRALSLIQRAGGTVVVQDPATAQIRTMPEAAIEAAPAAIVLPLPEIARYLVSHFRNASSTNEEAAK